MSLTVDEAIDQLCDKICTQCGEDLPRPGEECASCGELPGLLRQEAAEQLAQPGALARKQAEQHRQEAQRLLSEQVGQLLEADQVLHVDQLQQAKDRAEAGLTAGLARRDQAGAALAKPRGELKRAARERDDAASARRDFELELKKAERYKKGARAIVLARQALALADEELAAEDVALAAAQAAARNVESLFDAADAEVQRLTAARDSAARRLASPGTAPLSAESLKALGAPVMVIAREAFEVRMKRPDHQYVLEDVYDERISYAIGMAKTLGLLTGTSAAEEAAGERAGRKEAKDEMDGRPGLRRGRSLDDATIVPPGSRRIPGGILPGSPAAVPDPGRPSLALSQANPLRGGDPVYQHPGRIPPAGAQ